MKPQTRIIAIIAAELPDTQLSPADDLYIADVVMSERGSRREAWAIFNGAERAGIVRAARRMKRGERR